MKIEIVKYPRACEKCNAGMFEGYLIDGGTYCSLECAGFTEAEWNEHYSDDGEDCWTEWALEDCDDDEDLQFQAVLAKNILARDLRDNRDGRSVLNDLTMLETIEQFTGQMNQPSVREIVEDTTGNI